MVTVSFMSYSTLDPSEMCGKGENVKAIEGQGCRGSLFVRLIFPSNVVPRGASVVVTCYSAPVCEVNIFERLHVIEMQFLSYRIKKFAHSVNKTECMKDLKQG